MAAFLLNVFVLLCALVSLGDASPKVFSMRMYRKERSILQKRGTLSVNIGNDITNGLYFVNASVGTPPQNVQLQIDTGSSDVWMFGPHSCNTSTSPCLGGGCESKYVFYTPLNIYGYIYSRLLAFLYIWCI
jgi:hypothetical protein